MAEENTKKARQSEEILLLVAAIWGGGFVAGKLSLDCFAPLLIVGMRFLGSAVILGILFRKHIFPIKKETALPGCLIGCVQFAALLVQMAGLQYTSAMKQSFIAATYVVFTPFVAFLLLRARIQKKELLAALLAMIGVGLISLNGSFTLEIGDVMTLGFAVLFSLQIVLVEKYAKDADSIALTFYQFAAAGILALLGILFTGTRITEISAKGISGILYLVLINTALAFGLQNYAQKNARASRASLILSLESVFGFLFSALVFREKITIRMILGCALVFLAILVSTGKKNEEKSSALL